MTTWPKDNTAAKMAFYGDFHKPGWDAMYLVKITPPELIMQMALSAHLQPKRYELPAALPIAR